MSLELGEICTIRTQSCSDGGIYFLLFQLETWNRWSDLALKSEHTEKAGRFLFRFRLVKEKFMYLTNLNEQFGMSLPHTSVVLSSAESSVSQDF